MTFFSENGTSQNVTNAPVAQCPNPPFELPFGPHSHRPTKVGNLRPKLRGWGQTKWTGYPAFHACRSFHSSYQPLESISLHDSHLPVSAFCCEQRKYLLWPVLFWLYSRSLSWAWFRYNWIRSALFLTATARRPKATWPVAQPGGGGG